jgi:hypothetical protein
MKKKKESPLVIAKASSSFGQRMVAGMLISFFVYGLIAFISTKDVTQLGGAAFDMTLLAVLYGTYKLWTS